MTAAILAVSLAWAMSSVDSTQVIPETDFLPDTLVTTESYSGAGLTGYIDGGAEIVLEFGFERLTVYDIRGHDGAGTIEAYLMSDPVAAVGIFSQSHPGCQHVDPLTTFSCVMPRQRSFVRGAWYLRIVSTGATPSQALLDRLSGLMRRLFPDEHPGLPTVVTHPVLAPRLRELMVARGSLGVQSMGPLVAWLVDGIAPVELFSIPYGEGEAQCDVVLIRTRNPVVHEQIQQRATGEPRIHRLTSGDETGETLLVITPGAGPVPESLRQLAATGQ